jgi:heme-degrading monooxygenase HmoA
MPFISVTRLRVRSWGYLPQFAVQSLKSARQAERSAGFLGGKLLRNPKNTFWTMTAWNDEPAMNAFRSADAHGAVMRKLLHWCDEAAVVHWTQETSDLPSWQDAHRRMVKEGRPSKVNHPSPAQTSNQIPAPEPSRTELTLKTRFSTHGP